MKICNFGSLNIDYVYTVEHFVCPGETLNSTCMERFAGGKGLNQSIALARAGAQVVHAGEIGPEGIFLKETLDRSGVDTSMIKLGQGSTGHAIIQVDQHGENCILLFGGTNQQIDEIFVDEVLALFEKDDILLLQNEINQLPLIVRKAYDKGMRIALNPSPYDKNLSEVPLECIRWFIMNEIEGRELTGMNSADDIVDAMLIRYPQCCVMLTLGKKGAVYADKQQRLYQDIFATTEVDTTAAGDTFTGYFLAGLLQDLPMETILRRASYASSLAVSRKGASGSIPMLSEVDLGLLSTF